MLRRGTYLILPLLVALGGCNFTSGDDDKQAAPRAAASSDSLSAHDLAQGEILPADLADDQPREVMQAQVVLDRLGFTPGVVDGKEGASTRNAVMGFQEANDLPLTGTIDPATQQQLVRWSNIPATRIVTIPEDFAAGPFAPLPEGAADQAKLPALGYETLEEKLSERFHTTVETLMLLNPGGIPTGATTAVSTTANANANANATATATATADAAPSTSPAIVVTTFSAGQQIRVPNVGGDAIDPAEVEDIAWRNTLAVLGVGSDQPKAARIVVSKSKGTLKVFDAADKLVGMFTATMGSGQDPLPLGKWKINGVARNPPFHYNPKLFWDVADTKAKQLLPPGPNGPVGVAWIDLSKPHYGIHGTPAPETIGRAESHGCVRLTNWDVARLAQMVSGSTKVLFEA